MKYNTILLATFSSLLFASCCLRGRDDKTLLIPDAVKNALPYADGQSVAYLSSAGDTLKALVRDNTLVETDNCAECFCNSTHIEFRTILIGEGNIPQVGAIYADGNASPGQIQFIFGSDFFLLPLKTESTFMCDTTVISTITCHDSLSIQNQTYKNVFELENPMATDSLSIFKILYNADKGLLRLDRKDGRYWEIL